MEANLKYHHSAISRGYVGVKNAHTTPYEGRFGRGCIEHRPSKEMNSTSYHVINYYLEES